MCCAGVLVLGHTSCDADYFNFKLHYPGVVTDLATLALLRFPITCEKTMQDVGGPDLLMLVHSIV